jgi:hypothetical protein
MLSIDVLVRLDGDAVGSDVAIIIGHVDGDALPPLTLPNELAIRDFRSSCPVHCRRGMTPPTTMAAVAVPTSCPPLAPNPGVPLAGL